MTVMLMTMMISQDMLMLLIFLVGQDFCEPLKNGERGPTFRNEPPSLMEFSNTAGTELLCATDGFPPPVVRWQMREGTRVEDVPGLRYQRIHKDSSGSLVFPPFSRPEFRQEVHDAVYQCVATNDFGTIISREVHVKAVVKQRFSPQVYDEFVPRGNTAVLRCHLPSFAKEHVLVDAWLRNDGHVLKASGEEQSRGRSYTVLVSGELLIHDVQEKDSSWKYRCQTRHKLTRELVISETEGKIIVTVPHASTLPKFIFSRSLVRAEEGLGAELPCVAQGNPPPSYRWVKDVSGVLVPVEEEAEGRGRVYFSRGVLVIARVQRSDSGQYQCIARNSIGERRVETTLLVIAQLSVVVRPQRLELTLGQEATLSCNITGYPLHHVSWIKDLVPVLHGEDSMRVRLITKEVLHIAAVKRQDKGVYQCFAHNDKDSAQGSAQLHIADAPPSLISVFPERAVEPGEKVSMKCIATGNPPPKITWYLDDAIILRNKRPRTFIEDVIGDSDGHVVSYLNISESLPEDSGEYTCQANNEVGFALHGARLNVHGPPFVRLMRNSTAISSKTLILRCPYGGHPIRSIQWFKDGLLLPMDQRQIVNHTGILKVMNVGKEADEGHYSCVVKQAEGQTASGSTYVTVVVSPVIESLHLREGFTVNEKSRAKLMCVVNEGDQPLQFRWLKNGLPFLAHGDTTVQTFEDSSILTFKKISYSDRGLYTCVVSNKAASTNMTTQVVVNVPPQWIIEPQNTTAILGSSVRLDCSARGHPPPNLQWKKLMPTQNAMEDFRWLHSSSRAHRYSNGSLALSMISEEDAGAYLCQAHNGIGAGLNKIISLKVLIPPQFQESFKKKIVTEGSDAILDCSVTGDPPIDIVWRKDDTDLATSSHPRYSVRQTIGDRETSSELLVKKTSRNEDTRIFTCIASSEYGTSEASRQLIVQGPPDSPVNMTVTEVGSRTASLRWDVPHDGNAHRTASVIQYTDSNWSKGAASELIVSGSDTSAIIRSLSPITTYFVRVVAENSLGRSQPSEVVNITTLEEAPSGPPEDISVHSTGAQSMKVSWKSPPEDTWNGYIRGYYVGYRQSSSSEPYHFQKVDTTAALEEDQSHSTYITGLKPFTQYDVTVRAFNSAGTGPKSSKVVGRTLETAPPTSPTVQVASTSASSIDVIWEKNNIRDKSAVTEYTLHYKAEGDADWSREKLSGELDRYTLKGLKCGTRYNVYVTASNSLGTGEPSTPVTARTKGSAPMSPKIEAFVRANSTSVTLHLDAWQSMGCPITRFSVQHRPKHSAQWAKGGEESVDPQRRSYVVHPLAPGQHYVLLVTAHSEAGDTQGEYHFKTLPPFNSSGPSSYPAYGAKPNQHQPFYRNVALVIPVVVSSLVLVIVAFAIVVCLRKQAQDRRHRLEYAHEKRKSCNDSMLMMSDIKKTVDSSSAKSSHYSVPAAKKPTEYSEPYGYESNAQREGPEGLFATIKRGPTRPLHVQHKTDTST